MSHHPLPIAPLRITILHTIFFLFFAGGCTISAQQISQYNINIYNDLPTNFAYNTTVDHLGYLWITTERGVSRYNGYSIKNYDFTKGFANRIVWDLYEDNGNRMWLFSISSTLGYIYNDQYYNVAGTLKTYYPYSIKDYKDGVIIVNKTSGRLFYCIERNDSLVKIYDITKYGTANIVDRNGDQIVCGFDQQIHKLSFVNDSIVDVKLGPVKITTPSEAKADIMVDMIHERAGWFSDRFFFSYQINGDHVRILDVKDKTFRKVDFKELNGSNSDSFVVSCSRDSKYLSFVSNKYVYSFDTAFKLTNVYAIDSIIIRSPGDKVADFKDFSFWNKVISTNTKGVLISFGKDTLLKKWGPMHWSDLNTWVI